MSTQAQTLVIGFYGGLCICVGALIGFWVARDHWRNEMIKRGYARYHWMSGKWCWNEDIPKQEKQK